MQLAGAIPEGFRTTGRNRSRPNIHGRGGRRDVAGNHARLGASDGSVTAEMKTNFLNGAREEDFFCHANILKLGPQAGIWRGPVHYSRRKAAHAQYNHVYPPLKISHAG